MRKFKSHTKLSPFILVYLILVFIVFNVTVTYAWFSSQLTDIAGTLNLGELAATVRIYENYDDSLGGDTYIDGLTDAVSIYSSATSVTTYDLIQKPWYSNEYTSIYLEVENTGTIDLKSILRVYYDNTNITEFLSYYYYQLVDVTDAVNAYSQVTARENVSAYNEDFQDTIASNITTYISNITTNGYCIANSLPVINMGTTEATESTFYRLDVALSEIPTELLTEYNNLTQEEREISINAIVTLKQTNAPDDDNDDSGLSIYVSTSDAFINAINSASNGDTLYLTTNIAISRNVTITHRVNIVLNSYTLTINGNLAYDIGSSGITRLDVSDSSTLYVLGDLIIDTPNSTFKILGSGGSAQSVILGNGTDENTGDFYVNCLKDDNDVDTYGYYQYGVSVMKKISTIAVTYATMEVDSNTRVSIGVASTTGAITSVSGASNIEVYNYGEIQNIDFSSMTQQPESNVQIYIYNSNKFSTTGVAIGLPTWSLGWMSRELNSISNPINTRVINGPGSTTGYSVTGSLVFLDIDIENIDNASDSVIDLTNDYYRVNIQLDSIGTDTRTVNYYLQEYYNNLHNGATQAEYEAWLATIKGIALYTYNTTVVKVLDFTFINTYMTVLESLDLSFANIENDAIPSSAFYNKVTLQYVYFPVDEISIGSAAFYGTSIGQVTLSSSIVSVGIDAFNVNTSLNGLLEVFYESENTSTLLSYISNLTSDKTLLFMSSSNMTSFKTNYAITDAWYINSYTTYDFIDEYLNYYRIIDGNSVEVVYYGGNWNNLSIYNNIVHNTTTYRVVGISSSAYRRAINAGGTTAINIHLPSNMTYIRTDIFYNAYIDNLDLGNVASIGNYAFYNARITTSNARPTSFSAMTAVGIQAFANSTIGTTGTTSLSTFETANTTDGVINNTLDLHGTYAIGDGAFNSASFYGVVLDLSGITSITASMTNNFSLYGCELYLDGVTTIGDSAFELKFKSYTELYPYNKVSAFEVMTIGRLAFKGMYLDEFSIGIKTLYVSQAEVNTYCSYGGTTSGMIYSDFQATNLIIDGMLPEISSGKATFLFGSETSDREYDNVTIKNTNGLLYDFMFYGSALANAITITNLNLYDISNIGSYAFYYATVTNVYSYSGETLLDDSAATIIQEYAFRYSDVGSLGDLTLVAIETYAFADSIVPATGIDVTGTVANYAFYNSDTTGVTAISFDGTIGSYVFDGASLYTVTSMYLSGTIGQYTFENARIYDCTSLVFEDIAIASNTFLNTIISSACYIDTLGTSSAATLSFYTLSATTSTLDLTSCLTIANEALRDIEVLTVRLGNTTFYNNNQSNFVYGTSAGGIFTGGDVSTITNLYIDGELPVQRLGTYVLGANGANIYISNIYITQYCTNIPDYMFYSYSVSGRLIVTDMYIQSEDLTIGEYAFNCISVGNIEYDALNYGELSFTGDYAFHFATIGDFTNFVYYDDLLLDYAGVLQDVTEYAFQYTTFSQDSDLSLFEYASSIGNFAFEHATFTASSGGAKVSFDFTRVPTIGHSIFENIYSPLGTITLGNNEYYNSHLPEYYYGNESGSEGIFGDAGTITVEEVIIAGNLPDANVNEMYQTRALGLSGNSSLTIGVLTIEAAVTILPDYGFSGYSTSYRNHITTLDIYSSSLNIGEDSFAYTDITYFNIYSSSLDFNTKSFEYSILRNIVYDRTSGVGEITYNAGAEYTFQYATIYAITGLTDASSGVVQEISAYSFYHATFGTDCNVTFINYAEVIENNAFMYTTFSKTSANAYVSLDLSHAITLGEELFAFIPIKIGSLTLGNSSYAALYGDSYSYGDGVNGVLYGAGRIDVLNIVGNLPAINSYNALGNSYVDNSWSVDYGIINISSSVTTIPASVFISQSSSVPVTIETLNVNANNITIGQNAFYYAHIGTINFTNTSLDINTSAFNTNVISTININASTVDLGNSAFANSVITNIIYNGSTSGVISMTGPSTFANSTIDVMTGLTYEISSVEYGIVYNITSYAFSNAVFAQDCDLAWVQHVDSIGTYAFSETTFTKTSSDNFVDFDLTDVVTIGANAFYHLPISLGVVTIGNSSYTSNPFYAYGDGTYGIFNNAGLIQHLIIAGTLPLTSNMLGNQTSNISYLTTYVVVEINSGITSLPAGLFAGADTVYSTHIGSLYIYPTSLVVGANFLYNTVVTNLYIPNTTTFNGVGANAFRNSSITNINIPNTLTLTGAVDSYAFHSFDFTDVTLNVSSVSYLGAYAFSYITYDDALTFNSALTLIDANYAFAFANISGNLTFNSIRSLGSNMFNGIVSGTNVTYTFVFEECLSVTSDYAFANMNGGGTAHLIIGGLPTLNSYRAFYDSTNVLTIVFDSELINLNADNIFELADELISISFNNEIYVTVVNATITTIPSTVKIYVPGSLLSDYLMDQYWSLVMSQISTTYNIDYSSTWGFYILGTTYTAHICKYLGVLTTVAIPATLTYRSQTYTVLSLGADVFSGTAVTVITIPRGVENVNMDMFSNSEIEDVSFTGTGTEPFYIDTDANSNKVIYESSDMTVLYKYLPSNTSTSYTIETTVIEIAEKAFYHNDYLQTLTFIAGTVQNTNINSYVTTYPYNLTLSQYAIAENSALTTVHLQNNSSGFGVLLSSYAIASNPVLTSISITGFASIINSYSIYNNTAVTLVELHPATSYAYGNKGKVYSNISIEPYAFFGTGTTTGTACFYTDTYENYIYSRAFSNSRITLFEFNVNVTVTGYNVDVYNADAFAVGVTVEVNANGDVVQTYESIVIRVPSTLLATYQALPGFSFYYDSIVGVTTFTHVP
ncbi:MAG: leucine-rich repeat protein [Spirochaetales bacterium]